jgi:hypothetical protein
MKKWFLQKGNGHQTANRKKALDFVASQLSDLRVVDEHTVEYPPYGICHFAAYTDLKGAMISTPERDDNTFGSMEWHKRDNIVMFRDTGEDGRCILYICPIQPLFEKRTIGYHGVKWEDVRAIAGQRFKVFYTA